MGPQKGAAVVVGSCLEEPPDSNESLSRFISRVSIQNDKETIEANNSFEVSSSRLNQDIEMNSNKMNRNNNNNNNIEEDSMKVDISGLILFFIKYNKSLFYKNLQQRLVGRRRRRRRSKEFSMRNENFKRKNLTSKLFSIFISLLIINLMALTSNHSRANNFLLVSGQEYNNQLEENSNQPPAAFYYEPPQPLVYMAFESGSGDGRSGGMNQFSKNSQSSSMSPSLITAKCWNNYENDNECKDINVITASNANEQHQNNHHQQQQHQQIDDDSIITPIVILESSSTIEPPDSLAAQPPPAFLAPPYFSSSTQRRPSNEGGANVPLHRHRTPPPPLTANEVFGAPPAGATHLPPSWPAQDSDRQPAAVTRPTTSVFVATPAPKKPPKATTVGRKCRDDNDEDCDEPEGDGSADDGGSDDTELDGGGDSVNAGSDKADEVDGDDSADKVRKVSGRPSVKFKGEGTGSAKGDVGGEMGSGYGPEDDSESTEDDDDDDADGVDSEISGSSEPTLIGEVTTKHLEVEPQYKPAIVAGLKPPNQRTTTEMVTKPPTSKEDDNNNNNNEDDDDDDDGQLANSTSSTPPLPSATQTNGAEIEIVVHSTLPPTFIITTTTTTTSPQANGGPRGTTDPSTPFDNQQPPTSTTIMPDDTITSRPVFPSTNQPPNERLNPEEAGSGDSMGGAGGGQATSDGSISQAGGSLTTELDDLATFKPVPMPPIEPELQHRPSSSDFRNLGKDNSSLGMKINNGNNNNSDDQKLDDKYRFDPSAINTLPPQKFDSPWREKPPLRPSSSLSSSSSGSSEPWSSLPGGNRFAGRPRAQDQLVSQTGGINSPDSANLSTGNKGVARVQAEVLPTLLVYASIVIIVVTATIFCLVAFVFWRRNSARQRALLLHKTLNGGPSQHQMVGSMSHGSQLVANMQQPGLLSTYGPGKSLAMGKVTTSIIKSSDDSPIAEEDEGMVGDDNNSPKDSLGEGSLNGVVTDGNNQRDRQVNSSWSTSEDQTTTTTTTSGSQKTNDSHQGMRNASNLHQAPIVGAAPTTRGVHYSNSLSDERQNSSSMSDSQGSPIDNGLPMGPRKIQQQPFSPQASNYHPSQQQQAYHAAMFDNGVPLQQQQNYRPPNHVTGYYNPQAVIQQQQPYSPQASNYHPSQQQQAYHAAMFDNGVPLQQQQSYRPPNHVTGYYNPQAVIQHQQDGVERYNNSNRFMD